MDPQQDLARFSMRLRGTAWRLSSRQHAPFSVPPRAQQGAGRFDDPTIETSPDHDGYAVLYCAPTPTAAFLEVIAMFRPAIEDLGKLASGLVLDLAERESFLHPHGVVPLSWQRNWQLASARVTTSRPVFDLTDAAAVQALRGHLAPSLYALGLSDLDFSDVLGSHRQLTRAISRWLWALADATGDPMFAGVRYRSRFDPDAHCFALFSDRFELVGEPESTEISHSTPGFAAAAGILHLDIG